MQPKVTVVVAGLQTINKQDYPIEIKQEYTDNAPTFFNDTLDTVDSEIYCFMSHRDNFSGSRCVSKAIDRMLAHPNIGVAYSDVLVENHGYLSPLYYPAFHPNLLRGEILINSPLFVKKPPKDIRFNTVLDLFYFYEYLTQIGRKQFPIHLAHPIFTCINDDRVDLELEMKKLEQCLSQ